MCLEYGISTANGEHKGRKAAGKWAEMRPPGPCRRVRVGAFAQMAMGTSEGIEPWSSRLAGHFHPFSPLLYADQL